MALEPSTQLTKLHFDDKSTKVCTCAGWQSWAGGDTAKQTPSAAAQPAQSSSQSIMANTLPNPDVNPLAVKLINTPDVGGGNKRWISPTMSCNPWSGNSTLNGCITPQVWAMPAHVKSYCVSCFQPAAIAIAQIVDALPGMAKHISVRSIFSLVAVQYLSNR